MTEPQPLVRLTPLVQLNKVTKEYFGVPAIRAVDFTVLPGR